MLQQVCLTFISNSVSLHFLPLKDQIKSLSARESHCLLISVLTIPHCCFCPDKSLKELAARKAKGSKVLHLLVLPLNHLSSFQAAKHAADASRINTQSVPV